MDEQLTTTDAPCKPRPMPWQTTIGEAPVVPLQDFARSLESVIDTSTKEEDVQVCIESCPDVFGFLSTFALVLPKFRLADKFVPDFVILGIQPWSQAHTPTVTMVELELPSMPFFTKSGNPSSHLTHALRQLQDWKAWVRDHRSYLRDELARRVASEPPPSGDGFAGQVLQSISDRLARPRLPDNATILERLTHGFDEHYVLVAGRRSSMSLEDRLRLEEVNRGFHWEFDVITYDLLLDFARGHQPSGMLHFSG